MTGNVDMANYLKFLMLLGDAQAKIICEDTFNPSDVIFVHHDYSTR